MRKLWVLTCCLLLLDASVRGEEPVDASDPTKIYTFLGGGPKYTEFSNEEYLWELRLIGNVGLTESDMLLFEGGYGHLQGSDVFDEEYGWTNARLRWFHLFDMDYEAIGYRGWGTQVDMQIAGQLPGTDGQNLLVVGAMPTWNFTPKLSLYLSLNVANTWDKKFENYNGAGAGFDAQLIYSNDAWWPGAQIRLIPVYNYFLIGELEGEGAGSIDVNIGGEFTSIIIWDVTVQKNVDEDLKTFRRDRLGKIENDWNVFFNITRYF